MWATPSKQVQAFKGSTLPNLKNFLTVSKAASVSDKYVDRAATP